MSSPNVGSVSEVGPSSSPSVLSKFSYIGFDLDHTLARYNLTTLMPWLFSLLRSHVVRVGNYPTRLLDEDFDFPSMHKALVWDGLKGHFLKLAADRRVLRATHGYPQRILTEEEIREEYPEGGLADFDGAKHTRWYPFYTYFEMPAQILVAHMVECIDRGEVPASTNGSKYAGIMPLLSSGFEYHFGAGDRGDYFPAFRADPGRFLLPRGEVVEWLRTLRAQGKFLFLATNSRLDYTTLLAEWSFGPDWRELFDLIIVDCRKPTWFMPEGHPTPNGPHVPRSFFHPSKDGVADMERDPATLDDLRQPHQVWIHGNAPLLDQFFVQLEKEKAAATGQPFRAPEAIYFGDHLHTDCIATRQYTSWKAGAIVEEVEEHHQQEDQQATCVTHMCVDTTVPSSPSPPAASLVSSSSPSVTLGSPRSVVAPRKKYQTFFDLPDKLRDGQPQVYHPKAIFGSFFHHLPNPTTTITRAAATISDVSIIRQASPPSASPSPSSSPSSSPAPTWSYWHHVLSSQCEIVVGCLTDLREDGQQQLTTTTTTTNTTTTNEASSNATSTIIQASATTNITSTTTTTTTTKPAASVSSTRSPTTIPGRLNSTCLVAPSIVTFLPPAFGSEFRTISPAHPTPAEVLSQRLDSFVPEPVDLQYSIHLVPSTMRQELRAIFPELSLTPFINTNTNATPSSSSSSSAPAQRTLTLSEFKSLKILAIPTFQKAKTPLVHVLPEVEAEKNRLLESFYAWSKRVCDHLRSLGVWSELVDPCTGYPAIGVHGSSTFSEVDSAQVLLSYRMEQVGNCAIIDHPLWNFAQYPATVFTIGTVEQVQEAIRQVMAELAVKA